MRRVGTWQSEGWEGGVRAEGMRRVSVSPAWWGVEEVGVASALVRGAPPGVGAGWGGAGWHPGLGQGQGGWEWSCGWRAGGAAD